LTLRPDTSDTRAPVSLKVTYRAQAVSSLEKAVSRVTTWSSLR
jgi:hypothetical protein